jgi:HSP20 family protein
MTLVRWSPVSELASMEIDRLNRMFFDLYSKGVAGSWTPAVDIYETDTHELVLKAELPDVKREDITVTVENNVLTLQGERHAEFADKGRDRFQHIERHYGSFARSFTLPPTVDANAIAAEYKDGVLTLRIPQREEAKPRQIAIN